MKRFLANSLQNCRSGSTGGFAHNFGTHANNLPGCNAAVTCIPDFAKLLYFSSTELKVGENNSGGKIVILFLVIKCNFRTLKGGGYVNWFYCRI